jgi:YVTN family beta-propeller protein
MKPRNRIAASIAAVGLLLPGRAAFADRTVTETEEVVYVVNSYVHRTGPTPLEWSTISMLRGTTLATLKTLTLDGHAAHTVAVTPDGQRAWVTVPGLGSGRIAVIDTASFEVVSEIDTGDVGPEGVAFTRGVAAWVTCRKTGEVAIFNARTGRLLNRIVVGGGPGFIVFTPDGRKAYVVDDQHSQVTAIEVTGPDEGAVVATLPLAGHALQDAVVSPDGGRAYVANMSEGRIEVIDTATDTVLTPIPTDVAPRGIAMSPDGSHLFVAHWPNEALAEPGNAISMIRLSDGAEVASLGGLGNFRRIVARADGTRLFVDDHNGNNAVAIDVVGETLRVAQVESLYSVPGFGASPVGLALAQYRRPVPRVTINGSDGPVRLTRSASARLALSLDTNGRADEADWWVVCGGPTGVFYWTAAAGWTRTVRPAAQGPLVGGTASGPVVSLAGWPTGTYVFGFAVDVKRDGLLSTRYAYSDTVTLVLSE